MSIQTPKSGLITLIIAALVIGLMLFLLISFFNKEDSNIGIDNKVAVAESEIQPQKQQQDDLDADKTPTNGAPLTAMTFETGVENLPRSLQGTNVDGEIIINGNKELVPTRGLRRLYDYFLSALGEESAETIDARIEAYITSRTPEPAASRAIALYYSYKNYLERLGTLQDKYGSFQLQATQAGELDLNMLNQRQIDVKQLRQELFDAETVSAFFDEDNELHNYNIAMVEISNDPNLTKAQRRQARLDYVSRLPNSMIKERVRQKESFETLINRTEKLKSQGASDAELFNMRAELVGIPAAQRLAIVDQKNQDFDSRFQLYQAGKQQIIATTTNKADQQIQIKGLETQLFNDTEQKRLTGYEVLRKVKQQEAEKQKAKQ